MALMERDDTDFTAVEAIAHPRLFSKPKQTEQGSLALDSRSCAH